jgi:hypothetical protein
MRRLKSKCKYCGEVKDRLELAIHKETGYLRGECLSCMKKRHSGLRDGTDEYRAYKKDYCEMCGFTGHRCQLDVNHIDANHKNNDPENLETLCANCHRLVTFIVQRKI